MTVDWPFWTGSAAGSSRSTGISATTDSEGEGLRVLGLMTSRTKSPGGFQRTTWRFGLFLERKLNSLNFFLSKLLECYPKIHIKQLTSSLGVHLNSTHHSSCLRYILPRIVNNTNPNIINMVDSYSFEGFVRYLKNYMIIHYVNYCVIPNCYICNHMSP